MQLLCPDQTHSWKSFAIIVAVVCLGTAFRIAEYAIPDPLWADEAAVALNLLDRSYPELSTPLDHKQFAPIGWLFASRAMMEILGSNEFGFRAISFIGGLMVPLLVFVFARKWLCSTGLISCVGLVSLSPVLVRYSAELKPYSTDALFAVISLLMFALGLPPSVADNSSVQGRGRLALGALVRGAAGSLMVFFSFPVVFVLAGRDGAILLSCLRTGDTRRAAVTFGGAIIWGAGFVAYLAMGLLSSANDPFLRDFWDHAFLTISASPFVLRRNVDLILASLGASQFLIQSTLGGLLAAVAVTQLRRFSFIARQSLLAASLTMLAVFFAAIIHKWPLIDRLLLFSAPGLAVLIGAGVSSVAAGLSGTRWAKAAIVAVVLWLPLSTSVESFLGKLRSVGGHPVALAIEEEGIDPKSDVVLVYRRGRLEYELYSRLGVIPDRSTVETVEFDVGDTLPITTQLDILPANARILAVFGNVGRGAERDVIVSELEKLRPRLKTWGPNLVLFGQSN